MNNDANNDGYSMIFNRTEIVTETYEMKFNNNTNNNN